MLFRSHQRHHRARDRSRRRSVHRRHLLRLGQQHEPLTVAAAPIYLEAGDTFELYNSQLLKSKIFVYTRAAPAALYATITEFV